MDALKNISLSIALSIIGAIFVILGLSGGITISNNSLIMQELWAKALSIILGSILVVVAIYLEVRTRSTSKFDKEITTGEGSKTLLKQIFFPDVIKGFLPYNTSINASHFRVQNIIEEYKKELFLVGANQNFLLNLENSKGQFLKLVESLVLNKKVLILISDPEYKPLMDVYEIISSKDDFHKEEKAVIDSIQKIDKAISDFYGTAKLEDIKKNKLLEIRCTKAFLETFCFVDAGSRKGKGYFILIGKRIAGGNRPVFYFTEDDNNEIFAAYHERYRLEFEQARLLWPS